jgi:cytochrome c-type biogenesis protein CcmF
VIMPELGHFALIFAFGIAILLSVVPLTGAWLGDRLWMDVARPFAAVQMLMVTAAFGALTIAFVTDDFSVKYVAENSNSLLPWYYKFSAVWGGHEGSLLLWALILAGWTLAVALLSRSLPLDMVARVLGVMGIINTGFLSFILFTSNPFNRLLPNMPIDGLTLIHCCRILVSLFIRLYCIWVMSDFRLRLLSPLRHCWVVGWMLPGRAGRDPGRRSPGPF